VREEVIDRMGDENIQEVLDALKNLTVSPSASSVLKFDPDKDSVKQFTALFKTINESKSEAQQRVALTNALKGRSFTWWAEKVRAATLTPPSVQQILDELETEFADNLQTLLSQICARKQLPNETPMQFFQSFSILLNRCEPALTAEQQTAFALNGFSAPLKIHLAAMKPTSLQEIQNAIVMLAPLIAESSTSSMVNSLVNSVLKQAPKVEEPPTTEAVPAFAVELQERINYLENSYEIPQSRYGRGRGNDYAQRRWFPRRNFRSRSYGDDALQSRCFACNGFGHFARDCATQRRGRGNRRQTGRMRGRQT
jgi:hypothetical protein